MPRVAGFSTPGRIRTITSRQNPTVQAFRELQRRRGPDSPRVLIDGWHLLNEAREAGLAIERAAFAMDLLSMPETADAATSLAESGVEVFAVSDSLMEALSPVRTPSGVVAIARHEAATLDSVLETGPQLVLIAVDVQEPGNLGAMIRAGEAAGTTGVVACGRSADPFGWKALRGSMGSAFRLPIARGPVKAALAAARARQVRTLAAVPRTGGSLFETDLCRPTALLLGGEGPGLPEDLLPQVDATVSIPMRAPVESLNVAVATALLLYEAMRQRSGL